MNKIVFLTGLVLVTTLQSARADDTNVGVRQIHAPSKMRGTDIDVTIWYPAQAGGGSVARRYAIF